MIRKAQVKFIAIIMAVLLAVFLAIFGLYVHILIRYNENFIEKSLDETEQTFVLSNGTNVVHSGLVVLISVHPDDTISYKSFCDKSVYSDQTVENIVQTAYSSPYLHGSIGNVHYRLKIINHSPSMLIAFDMTQTMNDFWSSIATGISALLIIYGVLFLLIWRLSFNIFSPIREAFFKQRQFVSNASHELKTPLTIISANADVLSQSNNSLYVKNIKDQTNRLSDLITDMLTLAKLEEEKVPKINLEFNLSEEILNATLPFETVAFEKGKTLDISIEENINYKGHIQSVKQVVNILLDNAVKHADIGGKIKVVLKKENGKIIFSVSNPGSIIPEHDSNKVFERFYRGDQSRSRDSGGSGLGLSIAKGLADANKWKISAKSILDHSMTITVIF